MKVAQVISHALASLVVVTAGLAVGSDAAAQGVPPACTTINLTQVSPGAQVAGKYACVRAPSGGYLNQELHSGSLSGNILEKGSKNIGTWSVIVPATGPLPYIEYVYGNNGGTYTARFCGPNNTTVSKIIMGNGQTFDATVGPSCP